eukprot:TRINITY_DN111117_c0_g1_i1.p1 TRINITY_DN111117_c0_g1~~TRINITY_DN111117_c0_g1_i1.p1  ORF type:complete len:429 (+),score=77.07 TRINITY_DN111117_c0_g1_i1:102-1388(+)
MTFDYIVIGAGPAGLAAASNLVKRNGAKSVGIFDMRARPNECQGSIPVMLNSRGLHALRSLDPLVLYRALAEGRNVRELHVVPDAKKGAAVKTLSTCIMRDAVQQMLLQYAEALPEVQMHWEHTLIDLDLERRECVFQRADGSLVTLQVNRLIGADGHFSRVRSLCEQKVEDFSAQLTSCFNLSFKLKLLNKAKPEQSGVDPAVHYVLGDMGYCCCQPDGSWNFLIRIMDDENESLSCDEGIRELREFAEERCKMIAEQLCGGQIDETDDTSHDCVSYKGNVVKCSRVNPTSWICLVGVAAYATMQATGEDINLGLEDALTLSDCIREDLEDPFNAFNHRHLEDAYASFGVRSSSKSKVEGATPRQRMVNLMTTIGLSVKKRVSGIQGNCRSSYSELADVDERQQTWFKPSTYKVSQIFRGKPQLLKL